ncbi:MAG TPA: hypothetical protein VFG35_29830, partial [Actinoplanes sp.]|nr:hypothetical protein [Actinoplanes sp.]
VVKEKEAARTIAFSVLAAGSVVSVVGFGSSNGPGQSPVDVACPPTPLNSTQARDTLAKCVDGVHRRSPGEGADTDHAAALKQALSFVRSGGPERKLVFLLTDGKLDVARSPAYGDTATRRNSAAANQVRQTLGALEKSGAQVWPLGFGSVDRSALDDFARGKSCAPGVADPAARVTPDSTALVTAVAEAFSSATCARYGKSDVGDVPRGGSTDLTIDIPTIASDASILVYKRNPRVQVEYTAPGESKPAPAAGGTDYAFAGQTTSTESLRISDPAPGQWKIHLSSADVAAKDVTATVVYQAAVKAVVSVNPPRPAAGQTVDVDMQVMARSRAITDPQALNGLIFTATMSGTGVPAQRLRLTDAEGDGTYSARVTVPKSATGDLMFTGTVSGIGIGGDTRPYPTKIQSPSEAIQGQILFERNEATAEPGTKLPGTITVTNNSGGAAKLRVVVAEASTGAALTVDPPVIDAAAGTSTQPFTLAVGPQSALGVTSATLRLVDDADPTVVVAERLFAADVVPEPTIWRKLRWLWVALAVLLLAGLVLLLQRQRARNEARKVRGLTAQLLTSGFVTSEVEPPDPDAKVFRFVLHEDFTGPQLQPASAGEEGAFEVRRTGTGLELGTSAGRRPITAGQRWSIRKDLAVAVVDGRTVAEPADFGPVEPVSYDPFGATSPSAPSETPIPAPRSDVFDTTYVTPADPFAETTATSYDTADSYGAKPYDDDPFGPPDEERTGPGRHSRGSDSYSDPYNPFS